MRQCALSILEGDLFGFVGHNGAGKTTLLKSIAGIIDFDSGEITVQGISIKKDPLEVKKMIAYIPDNPDVYESLTGIQYLEFIANVFKIDTKQRKLEIDKYASLFNILDVLNNPISSYSHGMKQKLVIISALIHKPKLMLLDEPFVGLDPKASFQLKEIFKDMCSKGYPSFSPLMSLKWLKSCVTKLQLLNKVKLLHMVIPRISS